MLLENVTRSINWSRISSNGAKFSFYPFWIRYYPTLWPAVLQTRYCLCSSCYHCSHDESIKYQTARQRSNRIINFKFHNCLISIANAVIEFVKCYLSIDRGDRVSIGLSRRAIYARKRRFKTRRTNTNYRTINLSAFTIEELRNI